MKVLEEKTLDQVKSKFGDKIIDITSDNWFRSYIKVDPSIVKDVAEFLHNELGFIHANFCSGNDLDDKIEVDWYVGNPEYRNLVVIRVDLDRENPEVDSLRYLWDGMNWHERETFEMLGVNFKGHGDLRRLILPDSWDGFPLRNDYVYNKPSYRKPEDELMS